MSRATRRRLSLAVGLPLVAVLWILPLVLALLPAEASTSEIGMAIGAGEFHVVALHSLDRRASVLPSLPTPEAQQDVPAALAAPPGLPDAERARSTDAPERTPLPPSPDLSRGVRLLA
jgi:hypothetical protein